MNDRQKQLLVLSVETYIETAEPVGSKFLVEKCSLEWSEATVRNDLRELEELGFLTHPHTSAGRIPTEQGYKFYLDNLDLAALKDLVKDTVELSLPKDMEKRSAEKYLAKVLAALTNETVILAFSRDSIYYTGLSNLFAKPEFRDMGILGDVTQVFDRCEDCVNSFFDQATEEIGYFVGREHTFGSLLSVGSFRYGDSLLILLSPLRTDYKKNYSILNIAKELLNK